LLGKEKGVLFITNGDSAAGRIEASGLAGEILPWRDVLHEGPVPCGLSPEELSDVRARFLAERGWTSLAEARRDFARRDATLAGYGDHEEVVLFFEHDLYDQLQLIQVLDWFVGPWGYEVEHRASGRVPGHARTGTAAGSVSRPPRDDHRAIRSR
jgi:hypothetical protein